MVAMLSLFRKGAGFEQDEHAIHQEYCVEALSVADVVALVSEHNGCKMTVLELVCMGGHYVELWGECRKGYATDEHLDFAKTARALMGPTPAYEHDRRIVAIATFV